MKKTRGKLLSILMAATISATMLLPQAKVSASEDAAAKVQQSYFPQKVTMKKAAKKTASTVPKTTKKKLKSLKMIQ